jgi:hypothetical protein
MALIDLWNSDRQQVWNKRLDQLISFAGEGKLLDGNETSHEFRSLMSVAPVELLERWIDDCLVNKFTDFGLVLQDIVNEIGIRLGFQVTHGVYRGQGGMSHDGLWSNPGVHHLVVESKSSMAYRINLSRLAEMRALVVSTLETPSENTSILIVVGREDTDDLEAQVRGSRYAWNIRLISVDALLRLLKLRITLDDPSVESQIREILVPQEFTRLDRIVDLVFATAEDSQESEAADVSSHDDEPNETSRGPKANFHFKVIPAIERKLGASLVKSGRVVWKTPDERIMLSCQVSSRRPDKEGVHFWFGLKRTTKELLESHGTDGTYCAFGCGSESLTALIPFGVVAAVLDKSWTSPDKNGNVLHWHLRFKIIEGRLHLLCSQDRESLDVSKFVL